MKRIMFFGGPVFQIPIIQKAKEMGLYVGVVDHSADAPAVTYADEFFVCDILDKEKVLKIAEKFKPTAIMSGACDTSVPTTAYVCNKLGLVCYSEHTAQLATNKLAMIKAFAEYGVAHPKFQLVSKENVDNFVLEIPYPVISKPTDSAGSRGVCKIENAEELMSAVKESSETGTSGDVLIEEYMEGPEVSVEVVVIGNKPYVLQITDKLTSGAPHYYETGHCQPSALPMDIKEKITEEAQKAVMSLGITNSPAHVELKITKDGPKLIELGGRMGGDCITTHLINNSISGVNMSEIAINLALGNKVDTPVFKNNQGNVAIRFIPSRGGKVKAVSTCDSNLTDERIIKTEVWCEVGESYQNAASNSERFGFVVAKGNTKEEALNVCQKAIESINIIME